MLAQVPALVAGAVSVGEYRLVAKELPGLSGDDLRSLATEVRTTFGSAAGVVALVGGEDKPVVTVATTQAARTLGAKAGALVGVAAAALGGRGGGRDDLAQGGGSDASAAAAALAAIGKALAG